MAGRDQPDLPLTVPAKVGMVAFKAVAQSGDLSDGELRPIRSCRVACTLPSPGLSP